LILNNILKGYVSETQQFYSIFYNFKKGCCPKGDMAEVKRLGLSIGKENLLIRGSILYIIFYLRIIQNCRGLI
jgi:hypothetical protein